MSLETASKQAPVEDGYHDVSENILQINDEGKVCIPQSFR